MALLSRLARRAREVARAPERASVSWPQATSKGSPTRGRRMRPGSIWSRRAAVIVLALSIVGPIGAAVPSRADGSGACSKSGDVAGFGAFHVHGPATQVTGRTVFSPDAMWCIPFVFSCPTTVRSFCYFSRPAGYASSKLGGAGLTVFVGVKPSGTSDAAWRDEDGLSCRVGDQSSIHARCDLPRGVPSQIVWVIIRPGYDARLLCQWRQALLGPISIDYKPSIFCASYWSEF
jgi:hypothetical protein